MKTKTFVLSVFAIVLASAAFATKLPSMKIVPVESEKVGLTFDAETPDKLELTISNMQGEILYYKKTEKPVDNYNTVFDFSETGNGNYKFSLSYKNSTFCRSVNVSNKKVNVGEELRLYSPVYTFENNRLNVSFLNNGRKKVFLNVYQNGEYVTGAELGKDMCIQKAVDFSKLEKGTYDVVLNDSYKYYTYVVNK